MLSMDTAPGNNPSQRAVWFLRKYRTPALSCTVCGCRLLWSKGPGIQTGQPDFLSLTPKAAQYPMDPFAPERKTRPGFPGKAAIPVSSLSWKQASKCLHCRKW